MLAEATNARLAAAPTLASSAEAMVRVRNLLPEIALATDTNESERHVSDKIVAALRAAGLFGIVMPRNLGGSELGFADMVRVTTEIGTACGSTAWIYGVLAGHSWLINLFPEAAQTEIMADPTTLLATVFRLEGSVVPEGDGYRLTNASGRFCSGIDYANWVIVGNAVKHPDGRSEPRFFVIPKCDIEVVDDWHTMGMRGTGSRSIRIATAFVPATRSCSLADMLAGTSPGAKLHDRAIYRMPFADLAPFSIIGAPLGMARGAIARFTADLAAKLADAGALQIAEQSTTLARIAEASADVDAALALVLKDAEMVDNAREPSDISPLQRAQIPRNWAYAAQKARYAATRIFEAAGGSGIYDSSEIQRMFRDVNSAAQHFAFTWDSAMTAYGRAAAGLKPGEFAIPGRK